MRCFIVILFLITPLLISNCGCGCTPPMGLNFVLDSSGQNINSQYSGLRISYKRNSQLVTVPNVQLLMTGGILNYSDPRVFDAMNTIQISVTEGVTEFDLCFQDKKIGALTLKSHKELFDGKYVIDELYFNGLKKEPLKQANPNTYIFRLN